MTHKPIHKMLRASLFLSLSVLLLANCSKQEQQTAEGLAQYQGKWLVINYWAQWCKPCREEIPELNHLAKTHAEALLVLGVNYDKATGEKLAEQIKDLGIAFEQLKQDPAAELGIARPAVLPTTLIVTPDGRLAAELAGPQTEEKIWGEIQKLKQDLNAASNSLTKDS